MNTKMIMTSSAIVLGIAGLTLIFLPKETLLWFGFTFSKNIELVFQLVGALYSSLAFLNWMVKSSPIGGIYNRPIVVANLSHFMIGGLALIKYVFANSLLQNAMSVIAIVYLIFAVAFGLVFYINPKSANKYN
jgi:hypothetical protein